MENASIKNLASDYKKSIALIVDNKWLYGTILFFVLCEVITKIPALIGQKVLLSQTLGNTVLNGALNQYAGQSVTEKLLYAVHSIPLWSLLGSVTLPALFGFLGLVIAFLIFYRKIKPLRSIVFCKKVALYSALVLLSGIAIDFIAFFLIKNGDLMFVVTIVSLIGFGVLAILLLTIIETLFISLLTALLSTTGTLSLESLSEKSSRFIRTLFLFNIVLYFLSTNFVNQLVLLPNYLRLIMPNGAGIISGMLSANFFSYVSWFTYYFHPIFVVVFILTPFVIATRSEIGLFKSLKESLAAIKSDLGYYVPLAVWTLLLLFVILLLSKLINPAVLADSRPMIVNLIHTAVYSLLFTSILMTFYVTVIRRVLNITNHNLI